MTNEEIDKIIDKHLLFDDSIEDKGQKMIIRKIVNEAFQRQEIEKLKESNDNFSLFTQSNEYKEIVNK